MPLLTIVTFLPLIGVAIILLLKPLKWETDTRIRRIALATSVVTFIGTLVILANFNSNVAGFADGRSCSVDP